MRDETNQVRQRLERLGAEALADALAELAAGDADAAARVERILASPEENQARVKDRLKCLAEGDRALGGEDPATLARELEGVLADVRAAQPEPRQGVELVAAFFRTDHTVLPRCNDAGGRIGTVYRRDARDLFVLFASRCEDAAWVRHVVVGLCSDDACGTRCSLLEKVTEFLPETELPALVRGLVVVAHAAREDESRRRFLSPIASIAAHLPDVQLYHEVRRAVWPEQTIAAWLGIAEAYLNGGDAHVAIEWLRLIPKHEPFGKAERLRLKYAAYETLGDQDKLRCLAGCMARHH